MAETKKKAEEAQEVQEEREELIRIRLPLTKDQKEDVFVRVNHQTWLIKRGVTVKVPPCVVEVIEHSEQATLEALEFQQAHTQD